MDFNRIIREKREELRQLGDVDALDGVLRHLTVAERHFQNARSQGDTELFTDVIYRSNQVFEGVLKESFRIISGQDPGGKTTAHIEDYLSKKNVLRPRVLEYFSRYRKEWRNPATHNHRLDFDEQEAFLAYSTVCGFCFIAVNQMIQVLASQAGSAGRIEGDLEFSAQRFAHLLATELPALIKSFRHGAASLRGDIVIGEAAFIGGIEGLIKSSSKKLAVGVEPLLTFGNKQLQPDLLVSQQEKRIVVEIRRLAPNLASFHDEMTEYVEVAQAIGGVGVLIPRVFSGKREPTFSVKEGSAEGSAIYLVLSNRVS